ncbi:MAG: FG-GAP repeat protein [Planctomycetes bacterium]|nr:FG-GAP repeat protein [Planctomycetota bacterium]MCB9918549.1 FG-GAP repeat protein [Planctomycetota bacterium]
MKRTHRLCLAIALAAMPLAAQQRLFQLTGSASGDRFGFAVAGLGDINADGFPDYAVGAPGADDVGTDAGKVVVYSGIDGQELYTILGRTSFDEFGWAIAPVGDLDGDQVQDFLVGAPFADDVGFKSGEAALFSGKTGTKLRQIPAGGAREIFGISVAAAGDVDGDGTPDYIIGAHGDNINGDNSGSARVYSGKTHQVLWLVAGDSPGDFFGQSVAGIGDVDLDGKADFAVGAPDDDNNGAESGMCRIYSGRTGTVLKTLNGDVSDDFFGHFVSGAGDVDNDGRPDFIVGAVQFFGLQPKSGYARVFSGATFQVIWSFHGTNPSDLFGEPVRGAGDVNGDGYADLLVGMSLDDRSATNAGRAELYSGKDGSLLMAVNGQRADAQFGYQLAPIGDINKDNIPDFIVGAPGDRPLSGNTTPTGSVQIVSSGPVTLTSNLHDLSMQVGGAQKLELHGGAQFAGKFYLILGSVSGIEPGISLGAAGLLALNSDAYTLFTATNPNTLISNSFGVFDAAGDATANFILLTGLDPALVGTRFHHAFVVFDLAALQIIGASNAVPLVLKN